MGGVVPPGGYYTTIYGQRLGPYPSGAVCLDPDQSGGGTVCSPQITIKQSEALPSPGPGSSVPTTITPQNYADVFPSTGLFERIISIVGPAVIGLTPIGPLQTVGFTAYSQAKRIEAGMGLDIGALIGGLGGLAGAGGFTTVQNVLTAGGQIASAFQPAPQVSYLPQPVATPVSTPVYSGVPATQPQNGQVVRTSGAAIPILAGAAMAAARPILAKIAGFLGRRGITLAWVMNAVRKMAKFLQSPETIAFALGITTSELITLITADAARKHRRMNPGNAKALRRAHRRLESFHRLCMRNDTLRSRGRRRGGKACGTAPAFVRQG